MNSHDDSTTRIVIAGSEGIVGSAMMRCWHTLPSDAKPVEKFGLDLVDLDVASRRDVLEMVGELRPNVVVNATNISDRQYLESHPNTARSVIVGGAVNLRDAAERCGATFVQVSCVEATNGDTVFANTRRDAERAASEYQRHLIVRGSLLFGCMTTMSGGNIVETLLTASRRAATQRTPFRVIADTFFSPTWSDDFAVAVRELVASGRTGICEVANSGTASYFDIAVEIVRQAGLRLAIAPITSEVFGDAVPRCSATVTNSAIPLRSWQESLAAYLESRQK
ncbi:MAG: SDR family oxidoreductase [Thermoguttaceae bacterium]